MMKQKEHVSFEVLNDLLDGRLERRAAEEVAEHLRVCQICSTEHKSLQSVLQAANTMPASVLPPEDLWPQLRQMLEARKTVVLPNGDRTDSIRTEVSTPRRSWRMVAWLVAAAAALVVVSSGITALVLRNDSGRLAGPNANGRSTVLPQLDAPAMLPASFRQTENEYTRTIEELQLAVRTQRGQLSPETVRTVDRSLAVVDSAIAEARAALLADPNNRMLVDLLSASYQRKLDLLRRTSELGSRI